MNERARLMQVFDYLHLPRGRWVLSGSGVMVMHGIERSKLMGDVDIFVATRTWFDLRERPQVWKVWTTDPDDEERRCDPPYLFREVCGIEVNIFHGWRLRGVGDIDPAHLIRSAEVVSGVPCIPLVRLLDWKVEMGRAKDLDDIRAIREHLGVVA